MKTNSRAVRAAVWIISGLLATSWPAVAQTPPPLGTAGEFTILGGSAVTSTGESIINGDVGVSPGVSITGFPPGIVIGTIYNDVAPATTAHADTITAYNYLLTNEPTPLSLTGQNLGGMTLAPGVYDFSSSAQLTGTLTLNNVGNQTGTYVFQIASTLITASSSAVVLLGGSDPNVFWQVGTSATLGTGTIFDGDILADTSITLDPGASLSVGSALAINGAVTMAGGNTINLAALGAPAPSNPSSGIYWNGDTGTSWEALNWSSSATNNTGVGSAELLASDANIVFSVTGTVGPQNENTVLNAPETIASLTVDDPVLTGVSISGDTLTISGALGATSTLTINPGAAQTTINSNLVLGGVSQGITVNNTAGLVINGVVSGTIGLTKEGVGTLYLTNANIYSGGTAFGLVGDLVAGTVEIGDGATDGSTPTTPTTITPFGSTTVTVNAPTVLTTDGGATGNSYTLANNFILAPPLTVNVPTLTSLTMTGNITGVDGLTVNAGAATTGKLILTGDTTGNTYSGATLLQGGTLQAGTLSGTGNAFSPNSDFALGGGGTLDINGNSETIASLAGTVGTTVTNSGNGSAILTVNDSHSSIVGTPVTYEFDGTLTDAGSPNTLALVKQGPGALILTGANSYNGGTTLSAGTLVVGSPTSGSHSSTALGNGNVINFATLETTATLAGNTGSTTEAINVRGTYIQNAGGNLLLQVASSPLPTPSMNSGIAGVNYDTLLVTGMASLGGSLDLNFNAASVPSQGQHYVVVQSVAGPVMGQFSNNPTDTTGLPASFLAVTTYNDNFGNPALNNSAIVTLLQPFTSANFSGLTGNQSNVGAGVTNTVTALNNAGLLSTPTGVNADFFNNIVMGLNLANASGSLGAALDQLSPQRFEILHNVAFDDYALDVQNLDDELARERTGTGGLDTSGFVFSDSTLGPELSQIKSRLLAWNPAPEPGLLSDSSEAVLGGVEMSDAKDMKEITRQESINTWNTFIDGGVDLGDLDHNTDVSHASYTTGRVRAGADYRVSTNMRVGALIEYSHTDAALDNEGSMAHVDSYTPGLYAAYADNKGFYANGLFTYSRNDYSTDRDIIIPGVNRTATGSPSGNQFGGDLDGGYEFHKGNWTFGPSAGLTYVDLDIDSFNESGAGAADLSVNNQSSDSLRSRLGGTVRYQARIGSLVLTPHLSAFWQHEFLDNTTNITSPFVGLPGGTFAVQTTAGDHNNALLGFGIDAELNKNVTLFVDYGTEAGGSTFFGQSATGGVKVAF